jgi:hypothetical protein
MKRFFVFVLIPFVLFALEKVNLIKDAGFEKNNGVWNSYVGRVIHDHKPASIASTHDSTLAYSGSYSASCDTRTPPSDVEVPDGDSAIVIQGFSCTKYVTDLDSLIVRYSIFPVNNDVNRTHVILFGLYLDVHQSYYRTAVYYERTPQYSISLSIPYVVLGDSIILPDTEWHVLTKGVRNDLEQHGFSSKTTVDSLILSGWGLNYPPWHGQKIYFDDIRLTGYADYDVGVKSILSKDSVWKNTGYTPTARIKNFGRKAADSFLVVATIEGGSGVVYADTLSWSLTADTEDTVSFKEFMPDSANYTLTVSTLMSPDESDEDDAMSKTLYGSGVVEAPSSPSIKLEVVALSSIRYSLPYPTNVSLKVYDISGRLVNTLVEGKVEPGVHSIRWEGKDNINRKCSSGVYFVRFVAADYKASKKMVMIK